MINKIRPLFRSLRPFPSSYLFARVKFPLPDLGQKIKEGTVKKLYVGEGDDVQQFQKIADVESDKQFTEITAPEVGKIAKIYYKETEVCKVGDLFMEIQTNQQVEKSSKKPSEPVKQIPKIEVPPKVIHDEGILASPVVKMFAKSSNVDIYKVKGSGRKGRILKEDIINYIEKGGKQEVKTQASKDNMKVIKMNNFQKGMQKSMTESNEVPHLYLHETVNISEVDFMRRKLKTENMKVTMMGILMKTFSLALNKHPKMNSTYQPSKDLYEFETHPHHNISIAIDSPNGLVVPNMKNVQNLSLLQIQTQLESLRNFSNQGQLTKNHLSNGTICLSNIGTIAGVSACPLILTPQVCIVAIGKILEIPIFYNGQFHKRKQISLSFGCDHRVLDGASVARFSNEWRQLLENPWMGFALMR